MKDQILEGTFNIDSLDTVQASNYVQVEDGTTITTNSLTYTQPEYVDTEIVSYKVSDNKKTIEITVKQELNQMFSHGGTYISFYPDYQEKERVVKRIFKVKNGKLKLHKEKVGTIVPPESLPERYEFR